MCDKINVSAINLTKRYDRKSNIIAQFANRDEFHFTLVKAIEHEKGSKGLWLTICEIIQHAQERQIEYVLICEDDHEFSTEYERMMLLSAINEARELDADILLGGVSWFSNSIPVNKSLFWVEKFSGLQFTIVFNRFYETILSTEFGEGDAADYKISDLSERKYFIFPFISTQKEFGYSDVTLKNNQTNRVEALFKDSLLRVHAVNQVIGHYQAKSRQVLKRRTEEVDHLDYKITTYVMFSPWMEKYQNTHIIPQFKDREEFDVKFTSYRTGESIEKTYWLSLQCIAKQALINGEDVIVVCDGDHQFTEHYNRYKFLQQLIALNGLGVEVLCGGIDNFEMAIPISENEFWIGSFSTAPFLVLYRSVFEKILAMKFDDQSTIEGLFRELTSNKMVVYPPISTRKIFHAPPIPTEYNMVSLSTASRLSKMCHVATSSGLI